MGNNERAGDRVFTDVDQALAGRIVARSRENGGAAWRGRAPAADGRCGADGERPSGGAARLALLALPAVLALLVLLALVLGRRRAR